MRRHPLESMRVELRAESSLTAALLSSFRAPWSEIGEPQRLLILAFCSPLNSPLDPVKAIPSLIDDWLQRFTSTIRCQNALREMRAAKCNFQVAWIVHVSSIFFLQPSGHTSEDNRRFGEARHPPHICDGFGYSSKFNVVISLCCVYDTIEASNSH